MPNNFEGYDDWKLESPEDEEYRESAPLRKQRRQNADYDDSGESEYLILL